MGAGWAGLPNWAVVMPGFRVLTVFFFQFQPSDLTRQALRILSGRSVIGYSAVIAGSSWSHGFAILNEMRCRSIRPDTVAYSSLKGLSAQHLPSLKLCGKDFFSRKTWQNKPKHPKVLVCPRLSDSWISVVDPCATPRFLAAGHIFSDRGFPGRGKLWKDCEGFGKLDTGVRPVAGDRLMWILNDTESTEILSQVK